MTYFYLMIMWKGDFKCTLIVITRTEIKEKEINNGRKKSNIFLRKLYSYMIKKLFIIHALFFAWYLRLISLELMKQV